MKRAIPSLYAEYGRYIDEFRAIPYHIDCLKPVERRILLVLFQVAKKLTKSARVIGDVIGKYHPHGDQSAYGTLINLVRRGFAIGQGNWGASGFEDTDAAAYRYTEVVSNSLINSLAFEFIDYIPWHDPENISYEQPKFLPAPIPIGLVGDQFIQGISFHTTKIPRYNLEDLLKRLIYLFKKQVDPNTPPVIIAPTFPNCTIYEASVGELERILTTGEGTITVIPRYTADVDQIKIFGKPALGFNSLKINADDPNKPDQRKFNNIDMSQKTNIEVWVQPQIGNVDQPFINLIHKLISNNINFLCNVVYDDGLVKLTSIDQLLLNCYGVWVNAYQGRLNSERSGLIDKIYELQVIAVVRAILQDHSSSINNVEDVVNLYKNNVQYQNSKIGESAIRETISKHKIKTLLEYSVNTLDAQTKLNDVENKLNNMSQTAFDHLKQLFPNI